MGYSFGTEGIVIREGLVVSVRLVSRFFRVVRTVRVRGGCYVSRVSVKDFDVFWEGIGIRWCLFGGF